MSRATVSIAPATLPRCACVPATTRNRGTCGNPGTSAHPSHPAHHLSGGFREAYSAGSAWRQVGSVHCSYGITLATTRRTWFGIATAHDFESHDGMTEEN